MMNRKLLCMLWLLFVIAVGLAVPSEYMMAAPSNQADSTPPISVLQRIRDRGNILLVGVKYDFPPFSFKDHLEDNARVVSPNCLDKKGLAGLAQQPRNVASEDNLTGFDIDLIRAIAEDWGVQVEFVELTSADRIPLLEAGEVDIVIASLTHTREREAAIDFSQTYFLDGQGLLVRNYAGVNKLDNLQGKRVAAIQGTTSIQQVKAYAQNRNVEIEVVPFQEYLSALEALEGGQVEALTSDISGLIWLAKHNTNLAVLRDKDTHEPLAFTREPYAMGVPAGDYVFRHLVDAAIQRLQMNGCYADIYRRWFPDDATPYTITVLPGPSLYSFDEAPVILPVPKQSLVERTVSEPLMAGVRDDFPPFSYRDANGICCVGFYVDLINELAKRWRYDDNAVTFVPITSSASIQSMSADKLDIVAAPILRTWDMEKEFYFSQTYFVDKDGNFIEEPYTLGTPNNDSQFSDKVNSTLHDMQQDHTYANLYRKWFAVPSDAPAIETWPNQPALMFLPESASSSVTTTVLNTTSLTTTSIFTSSSGATLEPEQTETILPAVAVTQPLTVPQALPDNLPVTGGSFSALGFQQPVFTLLVGIVAILTSVMLTRRKTTSKQQDNEDLAEK